MKAIETFYNGYRFRSRIEARWAVFFTTLGVPFIYEAEGFDLGDAGWYLPDFWLPHLQAFFEVKGAPYTEAEGDLASALAKESGRRVYIAWGDCWVERSWGTHEPGSIGIDMFDDGWDNGRMWCECTTCGYVGIEFAGRSERLACPHQDVSDHLDGSQTPRLMAAYRAARAARFGT